VLLVHTAEATGNESRFWLLRLDHVHSD